MAVPMVLVTVVASGLGSVALAVSVSGCVCVRCSCSAHNSPTYPASDTEQQYHISHSFDDSNENVYEYLTSLFGQQTWFC